VITLTGWPRRDASRRRRDALAAGRDRQLLQRASRRIGLQTGALVFAAFCLCAGVLLVVVLRAQHSSNASTLRTAVANADDVIDPPNDTWLVVQTAGGRSDVSPGAPAFLPYRPAIAALDPAHTSIVSDVHSAGGEYRILTAEREGRVIQAAVSLAADHAERRRLFEALAIAGTFAIGVAGVLGTIAGRRSVAPLADALTRQRAFVADASHELRTPLTHLTTRAQLLERSLRRSDLHAAQQDTERLIADGRQLSATLEDLLQAAEPDDRSGWATVRLDSVADAGAAAVCAEAAQAGVTVTATVGDRQTPGGADNVRAPRTALDRAVLALLDNAIRHTPEGGQVTIAVGRARRWASLTVTDTGPGIPPEERDHLFDRFAHGDTAHGVRRRFGLGLALVADTAERLGGELSVEARTGGGTAVTLRLPLAF
jgi:two-component system OmpR family sensor kinase